MRQRQCRRDRHKPRIGHALIGLACFISVTATTAESAEAANVDGDAKPACLAIGKLINTDDTTGLKSFIAQASENHLSPEATAQIALLVDQYLKGKPAGEGPFFLVDRNYADSIHYAWYLLINGKRPLYLRCDSVRSDGRWHINGIEFNTDPDKVPLP